MRRRLRDGGRAFWGSGEAPSLQIFVYFILGNGREGRGKGYMV
jgi:hypothetical protein